VLASAGVVYGEMTTGEPGDPLLEVAMYAGAEPFRCLVGAGRASCGHRRCPGDIAIVCDVYTPIDAHRRTLPGRDHWLRRVHAGGALIASVCSGPDPRAFRLAGRAGGSRPLAYRQLARQHYPRVRWREESVPPAPATAAHRHRRRVTSRQDPRCI
jgi:hypothetical protein